MNRSDNCNRSRDYINRRNISGCNVNMLTNFDKLFGKVYFVIF